MIEEHKRIYKLSLAIVLAAAAVFSPFDRTITFSLLLGIALYYVYLIVLNRSVTMQLDALLQNRRPPFPGFFLRMVVLALPLFIAVKFQEQFNILAAFAPLFINHIMTFILYAREEPAA